MAYVYLIKYQVNYTDETKYKVFSTIENANNYHKNYKNHLIKNAYIEKYEILVMELDINLNNNELNKKIINERKNIYKILILVVETKYNKIPENITAIKAPS